MQLNLKNTKCCSLSLSCFYTLYTVEVAIISCTVMNGQVVCDSGRDVSQDLCYFVLCKAAFIVKADISQWSPLFSLLLLPCDMCSVTCCCVILSFMKLFLGKCHLTKAIAKQKN